MVLVLLLAACSPQGGKPASVDTAGRDPGLDTGGATGGDSASPDSVDGDASGSPDPGGDTGLSPGDPGCATGSAPWAGAGTLDDAVARVDGDATGGDFGYAADLRDVDGDGAADLLVSAFVADAPERKEGLVYVIPGPLTEGGLASDRARLVARGDTVGEMLGMDLSWSDDLDGDGGLDMIVSAHGDSEVADRAGAVWVLPADATGAGTIGGGVKLTGKGAGDYFGFALDAAGDTNGDGAADLVVGSAYYSETDNYQGVAFVFEGPVHDGASTDATAVLVGEGRFDDAGSEVVGAGDLDGDGLDDVLVGAPGQDHGFGQMGAVYLVRGPATTRSLADADAVVLGTTELGAFGGRVAAPGDVDGDGLGDVAVAATGWGDWAGAVYVFAGPLEGLRDDRAAVAVLTGEGAGDDVGVGLSGAGDVDCDGRADLAVGASEAGIGGEVYLWYGGLAGKHELGEAPARWSGPNADDRAGAFLVGGVDADRDGAPDLLVSGFTSSVVAPGAGVVWLLGSSPR